MNTLTCNGHAEPHSSVLDLPALFVAPAHVTAPWRAKMEAAMPRLLACASWLQLQKYYTECVPAVQRGLAIRFNGARVSVLENAIFLHFAIDATSLNSLPKWECMYHYAYLGPLTTSDPLEFRIEVPHPQAVLF